MLKNKKIIYPKSYVLNLSKYVTKECNYNCPYCINKLNKYKHIKLEDESFDETIKLQRRLNVNIEVPGSGESTLNVNGIKKLCESIDKNVIINSNGSNPKLIYQLLNEHQNLIVKTTNCFDPDAGGHFNSPVSFHDRIINNVLITPNTDLDYVMKTFDIFSIKTSLSTINMFNQTYKGSKLQKFLKANQNIIPVLGDTTRIIYGNHTCVRRSLYLDNQCQNSFWNFISDDIIRSIQLFKESVFNYIMSLEFPYSMCDIFNSLDEEIILDWNRESEYENLSNRYDSDIRDILSIDHTGSKQVDVVCDIKENIFNQILWNDLPEGKEFEDHIVGYNNLFQNNIKQVDISSINHLNEIDYYVINLFHNDIYDINLAGQGKEIVNLLADPFNTKLYTKHMTQLFRFAIKKYII